MKTFASALLLVCSASALVLEEDKNSLTYPGDKCCLFYLDKDYERRLSEKICIKDDFGVTSKTIETPGQGRKITSYICGKNVALDVCTYKNGEKNCSINSAGFIMQRDSGTEFGSKFDINMQLYNPAIRGAVTFFQAYECYGQSDRYYWKADTPFEGLYNYKAADQERSPASAQVPYGYSLRIYSDFYWQDQVQEIVGDYDDHWTQKPKCQEVFHLLTPGPSYGSWEVVKNNGQNNPDPAIGFWKGITSTESQEFEYHVGISNTESAGSSSESATSMEHALSVGIATTAEVGGQYGFISGGISTSYSADYGTTWGSDSTVIEDARTTMTEDYSITYKTTCTTEDKSGAGLYQYVYKTTDGRANLFTSHTVCRVGEHWNTPPACLWNACKNADCTCCEGDPDC